ncbi:DUF4914 family protein [Chitinispirillales bacterium ANBcel5]|uniref:DUF4914 family protein n=1 Tax=Cellulosispirillum alkaliphilum TaxID=3039283 RepID=UPI002A556B79|nr:DUF4914 family protein [Chitinispirillales bacterium ANBcel5]
MKTINLSKDWHQLNVPKPVVDILENCKSITFPANRDELLELAMGGKGNTTFDVSYDVKGQGKVVEASVAKCKNGLSVNYHETYMRRRDPDCMVVGDEKPSDKVRFEKRFGYKFDPLKEETFAWLKEQDLAVTAFTLGESNYGAIMIAPKNAGFFIGGLADLQGMLDPGEIPENFDVRCVLYIAPPFRHTHFSGKQVVVHNRLDGTHEIFSYNLYPGPSAKKGVYGALLTIGECEKWLTLHASTVQVVTPYDNTTTIMHEGASGSGKSEMLEQAHREEDGRILMGENVTNGEKRYLSLNQTCTLQPVTDDMAMCPHEAQDGKGYIMACDAEQAWFVRLNHIGRYGTDPNLEKITIHPKEPLIFLSIDAVPGSSCLIWDHVEDSPGIPCPNPRVILPRRVVPDSVDGVVEVNIRNFGIRTPPCTKETPSYGVVGFLHILPPALGWLWRLVSPRGHANPSITETDVMTSEGVGSYWPFATGLYVDHANLLLRQIQSAPDVRYTLTPNQHVGAYRVSFNPQWVAREYLARRGMARFKPEQLIASRSSILGYTLQSMQIEGTPIPHDLLRVDEQPEVGTEGFDAGAEILRNFFIKEIEKFNTPKLDKAGRKIIECCMDNGTLADFEKLV